MNVSLAFWSSCDINWMAQDENLLLLSYFSAHEYNHKLLHLGAGKRKKKNTENKNENKKPTKKNVLLHTLFLCTKHPQHKHKNIFPFGLLLLPSLISIFLIIIFALFSAFKTFLFLLFRFAIFIGNLFIPFFFSFFFFASRMRKMGKTVMFLEFFSTSRWVVGWYYFFCFCSIVIWRVFSFFSGLLLVPFLFFPSTTPPIFSYAMFSV